MHFVLGMTTFGDLISDLYAAYSRRYHDGELAAVATEVTLTDALRARATRATRARPVGARTPRARARRRNAPRTDVR